MVRATTSLPMNLPIRPSVAIAPEARLRPLKPQTPVPTEELSGLRRDHEVPAEPLLQGREHLLRHFPEPRLHLVIVLHVLLNDVGEDMVLRNGGGLERAVEQMAHL